MLEDVNRERRLVREDENGVMKLSFESDRELAETVRQAYDGLESQYPTLRSGYGPPKAVLASRGMSYLDITGVFFAYTFEANVNVDVPDYSIPATMGHELSHLRGYMREDEANFWAIFAAGKAAIRICGTLPPCWRSPMQPTSFTDRIQKRPKRFSTAWMRASAGTGLTIPLTGNGLKAGCRRFPER